MYLISCISLILEYKITRNHKVAQYLKMVRPIVVNSPHSRSERVTETSDIPENLAYPTILESINKRLKNKWSLIVIWDWGKMCIFALWIMARGFLIGAPASGSGKTTIARGLMALFAL